MSGEKGNNQDGSKSGKLPCVPCSNVGIAPELFPKAKHCNGANRECGCTVCQPSS